MFNGESPTTALGTPPLSTGLGPTLYRQQGLLTNRQCDEFGISRQTRSRLVQQDRWRRPARGVYDTDPVPLEDVANQSVRDRAAVPSFPHGAAHVHELFPLVDERAESTAESSVRLSFVDNDKPGGIGKQVARVLKEYGWRRGQYLTRARRST